jgi:hypothetical protein
MYDYDVILTLLCQNELKQYLVYCVACFYTVIIQLLVWVQRT